MLGLQDIEFLLHGRPDIRGSLQRFAHEPLVLSAQGMQSSLHQHSFSFTYFILAWPCVHEGS